jgi:hypothetical protein
VPNADDTFKPNLAMQRQPKTLPLRVDDDAQVWHDNSGLGPAWHLDYIEVHSSATGRTYYFPCKCCGMQSIRTSYEQGAWTSNWTPEAAEAACVI